MTSGRRRFRSQHLPQDDAHIQPQNTTPDQNFQVDPQMAQASEPRPSRVVSVDSAHLLEPPTQEQDEKMVEEIMSGLSAITIYPEVKVYPSTMVLGYIAGDPNDPGRVSNHLILKTEHMTNEQVIRIQQAWLMVEQFVSISHVEAATNHDAVLIALAHLYSY